MDAGAAFVADARAAHAVKPGEGALYDVADRAQAGSVRGAPSRDLRLDAAAPQLTTVDREVVSPAGIQGSGPAARPSPAGIADPGYGVEQREQLGAVVPIASHAAGASRSSQSRSRDPGAATPTATRCAARTRSRTGPCGHHATAGPDRPHAADTQAAPARSAATDHR